MTCTAAVSYGTAVFFSTATHDKKCLLAQAKSKNKYPASADAPYSLFPCSVSLPNLREIAC